MTEEIDPNIRGKYDIQQKLGKGAYGIVWQVSRKDGNVMANKVEEDDVLALKKCFDCFRNDLDAQRTVSV